MSSGKMQQFASNATNRRRPERWLLSRTAVRPENVRVNRLASPDEKFSGLGPISRFGFDPCRTRPKHPLLEGGRTRGLNDDF